MKMIRGERADYSRTLFEIKGTRIHRKAGGEFVDLLRGVYPSYVVKKIFDAYKVKTSEATEGDSIKTE